MIINGERVGARSGEEHQIINPANEEVVDTVPAAGAADVEAAVAAAKGAAAGWARTDPDEKARIIREGLARVRAAAKESAGLLTREQGKPTGEAMGELHHFLHGMDFYADMASKLRGAYVPLPSTFGTSYGTIIKRPVGVVAAIVPFNFPLTLLGTKLGPALVTGCTLIAKPAESTPLATLRIAELMLEAGLPPGVFNVVTGRGSVVGPMLIKHPDVRRVAFTGGTNTGRQIAEMAAPQFKRVSLELGGSDPVIICPDANVESAVKNVVIGRYFNAGQMCLACKRLYVFAEVYDEVMQQLINRVGRFELGEGWTKAEKPNIRMGPLHNAQTRDDIAAQVRDAVKDGASVALGGQVPSDRARGFFYQPTILENAPHASRVVQEESFGPVLPVFKVRDIDEAIRLANDSPYGLGSSVWTYNIKYVHKVAQEVEAGMTWVNQMHYGYDELPFGGVKASGMGREHGPEALDYYQESKSVVYGDLDI
jgi:succinate-semialdehyde dehydrogenase/glutarate-semialdehyde dehydrogenase